MIASVALKGVSPSSKSSLADLCDEYGEITLLTRNGKSRQGNKVGDVMQEDKRDMGDASPPPVGVGPVPMERSYGIRIARDGTWFHDGDPIKRIELAKLFATVLRRDDAGDYWLITPVERGRIVVEDVPFVAVEMTASGTDEDQVLLFRTNLDEWVEAGPDHPIRVANNPETDEPVPYIEIRKGLEARIARSVYYDMVDRCVPKGQAGEAEVGIWSKGSFFVLGRLPGE